VDEFTSYGKVYALGRHRDHGPILDGPVYVEEKIDGSQFSFRMAEDRLIRFRSSGQEINPHAPGMFAAGVAAIQARGDLIPPGITFRGEYLAKPRHNVIAYERIPRGHVILWGIDGPAGEYETLESLAEQMNLESVPVLRPLGPLNGLDDLAPILASTRSILGGPIEGVVIKSAAVGERGQMRAKVVTEAFRETRSQPAPRASDADFFASLGRYYSTSARWDKAILALRERGEITDSGRDIGGIIRQVQADVFQEHGAEIAAACLERARKEIARGSTDGLPAWYLERIGGGE
jgi:hypothetical protein